MYLSIIFIFLECFGVNVAFKKYCTPLKIKIIYVKKFRNVTVSFWLASEIGERIVSIKILEYKCSVSKHLRYAKMWGGGELCMQVLREIQNSLSSQLIMASWAAMKESGTFYPHFFSMLLASPLDCLLPSLLIFHSMFMASIFSPVSSMSWLASV